MTRFSRRTRSDSTDSDPSLHSKGRSPFVSIVGAVLAIAGLSATPRIGETAEPIPSRPPARASASTGPLFHIDRPSEKLEITVNTSRILTFQHRIPDIAVNNRDLLEVMPVSPTQIRVFAKKPGVTQLDVWDETHQRYTVDVVVRGDSRELTELLTAEFPNAAVKVTSVASGVLISGYVDRPEEVDQIKQLAEEFYPKAIVHLTVAGVQQVLLHVKVYEVSRTKLRQLGFDFAQRSGESFITSAINKSIAAGGNGVLAGVANANAVPSTFAFNAVSGGGSFFGTLDALRQNDLAKICSEPTLVTQSGRPAYFNVGGEIPYAVSQGLGAVSIEWKNYGTRLDFVPFVLGNGRIRLEVRPQVSEVDNSRSQVSGVPAIKIRESDTGVELEAGQTLAIAGLVQTRIEAQTRGLPWVSDLPYVGAMFRHVREESNEIETLILVTPEIAEALDPHEVPPCGPGTNSSDPSDWELYMLGKIEVSNCPTNCHGHVRANSAARYEAGGSDEITDDPQAAARRSQPPAGRQFQASSASDAYGRPTGATQRGAASGEFSGRNSRYNPPNSRSQSANSGTAADATALPGYLGPIGYDVGN